MAFSPDGKTVLTGSDDQTARLWPVPTPLQAEPQRIVLWLKSLPAWSWTNTAASACSTPPLGNSARQRLQDLGGPPEE